MCYLKILLKYLYDSSILWNSQTLSFLSVKPYEVYDTGVYPAKPSTFWEFLPWRKPWAPPDLIKEQSICLQAYLQPVLEKLRYCSLQQKDLFGTYEWITSLQRRLNNVPVCQIDGQNNLSFMYFKGAKCDKVTPINSYFNCII